MGLRPTKNDEGARDRCRGINNLDRAFNRAVASPPPEQGGIVSTAPRRGLRIALEGLAACGPLPCGRGSVSGEEAPELAVG